MTTHVATTALPVFLVKRAQHTVQGRYGLKCARLSARTRRPASADASQGASKRQNTAWGWLWKNTTFSDIKIVLVADGTAQGSATA